MKFIILITSFVVCATLSVYGQQDAQFSQYMFNKSFINPAATGSDGLNATMLYRNQWLSQPGAPKSYGIAVDAPVANNKVGIGLIFLNTTQGPLAFTRANANFSYKIKINDDSDFLFGLQAGVVQYGINTSSLITTDNISADATFNENNLRRIIPDFGLGLMYKSEKFYIGITIPHLLQSKIKFINEVVDTTGMNIGTRNTFAQIFRHYYTTAGVNININDDFKVQPAVLVRYVINAPIVADINTNVVYKDFLWAGAGYRISNFGGIIAMLGVNISDRFRIGYAFNMTTGGVSAFTGTSHEIMVNYHVAIQSSKGSKTKVKKFKGNSKKPYFLK